MSTELDVGRITSVLKGQAPGRVRPNRKAFMSEATLSELSQMSGMSLGQPNDPCSPLRLLEVLPTMSDLFGTSLRAALESTSIVQHISPVPLQSHGHRP